MAGVIGSPTEEPTTPGALFAPTEFGHDADDVDMSPVLVKVHSPILQTFKFLIIKSLKVCIRSDTWIESDSYFSLNLNQLNFTIPIQVV